MSTTTTAIVPRSVAEAEQLSHSLSKSSLVAEALRAKPHDVLAAILTGAELGLPPMAATKAVVMIKGRPTLSAQALVAVALAHPSCVYLRCVETTPKRAIYETLRKGHPEPTRLTWTIEQAQTAGLGGDNWRKYPAEMLRARCQAAIVRMVYPDATLGMLATEELSDAPADLSEVEVDAVRVTEARPEIVSRQAVAAVLPPAPEAAKHIADPGPEREPGEDDGDEPVDEEAAARRLALMVSVTDSIDEATSLKDLEAAGKAIKEIAPQLAPVELDTLREAYAKRKADLQRVEELAAPAGEPSP